MNEREAWRLTAAEVHGRPGISGVSLSPDGANVAYTQVRHRLAEEDREGNSEIGRGQLFELLVGFFDRELAA